MRRRIIVGLGVLLGVMGMVWTLQGVNVLPGSFMTGQPFWASAGIAAVIAGLGMLLIGLRRPAAS